MCFFRMLYIFVILLFSLQSFAKDWALLLSGGSNKESNHFHYRKALQDMHTAFLARGFRRQDIFVHAADGQDPKIDGNYNLGSKYYSTPVSLQNDNFKDIDGPASRQAIEATFDKLAKKVQPGDRLLLFVTDHGNQSRGAVLWNGEYYATDDFKTQIEKLPDGVVTCIAATH